VPEDYAFAAIGPDSTPIVMRMSELFRGGDTLMVYHYMFPRHSRDERAGPTRGAFAHRPLEEGPCPSCTALIDMWEGTMPHFEGLGGNLVVVARAPIEQLATFARERGWKHTRLISAAYNSFRRDYGSDGPDGEPVPIMTVFTRQPDGVIRLHWASELVHSPTDPGQDMRHLGTVEPLWTLFDLRPGGRPTLTSRSITAAVRAGQRTRPQDRRAESHLAGSRRDPVLRQRFLRRAPGRGSL
jgi:predicted dithiol-disulfide oxidoreductase (DUF899 family)